MLDMTGLLRKSFMLMDKKILLFLALSAAGYPLCSQAQSQFKLQTQEIKNADNEPAPVFPVPSDRQLKWNETEFYAFYHYGMNTYTDKEWGGGGEPESKFAPTAKPNPRQWLETAKKAGMKGGIAVVKHHDGFCLWPTETTTHSVLKAGNANGRTTNIPKDFAEAAHDLNMKYGFYVSPWDMNSAYWGDGTDNYAKKVFLPQCAELAKYGADQFEMWFDGATGGDHDGYYGGANTTRTISDAGIYYDMPNLRDSIHNICPNIIMWGLGGEARWIGNEAGWAGETCWSMGDGTSGDENGWLWHPGESDAKATNKGWFWHAGESPLSAERLFQMYLETVGRNATLILNLPPDKSGSLPPATVNVMTDLGELLTKRLGTDLARNAKVTVSEERKAGAARNYVAANLTDDNKDTYWAPNDGTTTATITLQWDEPQTVRYVSMMEYIKLGQRVKGFTIETSMNGTTWTSRGGAIAKTTIGYKRIIPLNGSTSASYTETGFQAKYLRVKITNSKACPLLHTLSVY